MIINAYTVLWYVRLGPMAGLTAACIKLINASTSGLGSLNFPGKPRCPSGNHLALRSLCVKLLIIDGLGPRPIACLDALGFASGTKYAIVLEVQIAN
jgi:hypothetical protein